VAAAFSGDDVVEGGCVGCAFYVCFYEGCHEGFFGRWDGERVEGGLVPADGGKRVEEDFHPGLFAHGEAGEEVVGY